VPRLGGLLGADGLRICRRTSARRSSPASPISVRCGSLRWIKPASNALCSPWPDPACRPNATPRLRVAGRARRTISWRAKSTSARTAIPASPTCHARCRRRADELERSMRELKFCGAMINGHTNGNISMIARSIRSGTRAGLGGAHLSAPGGPGHAGSGIGRLQGAAPGDLGMDLRDRSHALRIVFGGVFDRFPRARLGLGHLGETLPFLLWRFDSRTGPDFYAVKLAKRPSEYVKENMVVATSACAPPSR